MVEVAERGEFRCSYQKQKKEGKDIRICEVMDVLIHLDGGNLFTIYACLRSS